MPTKLAKKLIRQILLITLISLLVSFGLAYGLFWPKLRDEAHDRAVSASQVIMLSINETMENLDSYGKYTASSSLLADTLEAFNQAATEENRLAVCDVLLELKSISSNMRTMVLISADGTYFQAGPLGKQDEELLESSWVADTMDAQLTHNWSSFYLSDVEQHEQTIVRVSAYTIGGRAYTLLIFYDASALMERIDTLAQSTYTGYILTDYHDGRPGIPFFESGSTGNAEEVAASYLDTEPYAARDSMGYYFIVTIPASGWRLVGYIDRASFNASLVPFVWLLLLICVVLGLMVVLLFVPAVRRMLAPLGELGTVMKNVSSQGGDYYSPVQTDDEIGELSDIFNDMLDEMRINASQALEQQSREQHLTYNLMVAQINSHFFYNTLSVISSLARQGRTGDVIRANTALATIFQDCLRPQSTLVGDTVAQEKHIVECYWVIESLDANNQGILLWVIPEELMEARIPKNIIQPLVENALFHGLDDADTGVKSGWIKVSVRRQEDRLRIEVSNTGAVIPPDILVRINAPDAAADSDAHIGLANIRRRLDLIYGDSATLTITSDGITRVVICMPDSL
ncbi:MAG: histidine kinase [Oscillospiraceae bacterium]|nr:histidine kinase [Oscillospiraceae bacterium]